MSVAIVKIFESAMNSTFDLTDMLGKIDTHHIIGNLNDVEFNSLVRLAREKADPSGGLNVMAKLQDMENRIRALEEKSAAPEGGVDETVEEYTPGKWYRAGDKVAFDNKVYVCTAPDGQVCVWSPAEYPAYWEVAPDA